MPPAARMPSAPSGGLGMPSARCDRPHAAKVSAMVPTTMRLVAASSCGARSMRRPRAIRTSGTAYATRPKVPAKTACTTWPKVPETPHHSRAATTTARAMRAKPMPSRRCSGSRSAALWPTRRTAPPARCETPIHVLRIAPSGKGRPPPRALDAALAAGLRAAGLRCAGRADRAAGGRDVAPPEDPLARVAAVVLERWLLDGRDAMVAPYVNAAAELTRHTRNTGGRSATFGRSLRMPGACPHVDRRPAASGFSSQIATSRYRPVDSRLTRPLSSLPGHECQ